MQMLEPKLQCGSVHSQQLGYLCTVLTPCQRIGQRPDVDKQVRGITVRRILMATVERVAAVLKVQMPDGMSQV